MTTPPSGLGTGFSDPVRKQNLVNWVFDQVAPRYDLGNDIMSLGWHSRWKRRLVDMAEIEPRHEVLDLACGTGDTTFMVARRASEGRVVGSDINPRMMALAETKRPPNTGHVQFVEASGASLPFPDASFDRVTCTYAGRGFPDWPAVLAEMYRVLRPGGRFYNLDFGRPSISVVDWGYRTWLLGSGAVLGTVLHGSPTTYMYIPVSMRHYKGPRWLDTEAEKVGFETKTIETFLGLMAYNVGIKP